MTPGDDVAKDGKPRVTPKGDAPGLRQRRPPLADLVRDDLRRNVLSGVYPPGQKLPSEPELAASYNVSRVTLREAVRGLIEEGYLSRQHGVGTYVTKRPKLPNNLDVNFGVTHLIEFLGMQPGNLDVRIEEEKAVPRVAEALALDEGERVARLERTRTADGDPIVFSIEFIPCAILPNGAEDLSGLSGSLYEFLEKLGKPVHHGIVQIKSVPADRAMGRRLMLPLNAPLMYLEQVDFGVDERPVLYALEWYRAEDLEFAVYRKGPYLRP